MSGAITGALGPVGGAVSTVLVHAIVGGAVGAGAQAASNLVEGKPLGDGVLTAAVIGGVTGGISGGMIARQAAKAAGPLARDVASGAHCALSFSPDTQVATPNGEQAIGTLQVGDQVTAYDPATGQTSTQPVLHVWINHDTDLVDVTLRSDANASQPGAAASTAKVREADARPI